MTLTFPRHFCRPWTAVALVLLLFCGLNAGCASRSPATNYYILDSGESTPSLRESKPDKRPRVQLRRVDIPGYLDRNAIVTRDAGGVRLTLAEFHAWAESLGGGAQRVLSEVLTPLLLERGVLLQAMDDDVRGPLQLFVQVQRFDGILGGEAVLDARWTLRNEDDKSIARGGFVDREPAGNSYDSLVLAQSQLLRRLGQALAEPVARGCSGGAAENSTP